MVRCDFCYEPNPDPLWTYPCKDFTMDVYEHRRNGTLLEDGSQGDWAVCDACSALIEAGDVAGLATRAVEGNTRGRPEHRTHKGFMRAYAAHMVSSIRRFQECRTGPRYLTEPPTAIEHLETDLNRDVRQRVIEDWVRG